MRKHIKKVYPGTYLFIVMANRGRYNAVYMITILCKCANLHMWYFVYFPNTAVDEMSLRL